jgi:hypothetical protein
MRYTRRYTQVQSSGESTVIPAWMPETSAMDGNFGLHRCLIEQKRKPVVSDPCDWIPASMPE